MFRAAKRHFRAEGRTENIEICITEMPPKTKKKAKTPSPAQSTVGDDDMQSVADADGYYQEGEESQDEMSEHRVVTPPAHMMPSQNPKAPANLITQEEIGW